jgi:hypothetical protein
VTRRSLRCSLSDAFSCRVHLKSNTALSLNCNTKGKVALCLTDKHYAMKAYGEVGVYMHIFLFSALVEVERSGSRPGRFTPSAHCIGGYVEPV